VKPREARLLGSRPCATPIPQDVAILARARRQLIGAREGCDAAILKGVHKAAM
jgi:hypothetical protein